MNVCGEKPLTLLQLSIKILYHYEATSYSHQNSHLYHLHHSSSTNELSLTYITQCCYIGLSVARFLLGVFASCI